MMRFEMRGLASVTVAVASALCVMALSGCRTDAHDGRHGTLIIASSADADNLLPPLASTGASRQVVDQIFDNLADIGPAMNTIGDAGFTPRLARSWDWARDSMSVAFHIDPAARWHDGHAVTARDVSFTYRLLRDTTLGSPVTETLGGIDSVTVRDSLTAVVWFHRKSPDDFFDFVYNVAVLPEHLLAGIKPSQLAASTFARHPVGSGRFRFSRWDAGSRIVIVADSANYRGRAKLDRVVWVITPDPQAARTRFLSGSADFIEDATQAASQIERSPTQRLLREPALDYIYLGFNTKRAALSGPRAETRAQHGRR